MVVRGRMVKMRKIVKKIGNSVGILFNRDDQSIFNIEVDDVIDISDITVTKKSERKTPKNITSKTKKEIVKENEDIKKELNKSGKWNINL